MTITRTGFDTVVNLAFAGLGFLPQAAKQVFPHEMFLPSGDLSPIKENIGGVINGLTKWEPETRNEKKVIPPPKIRVTGKDYDEALTNINKLFLKNLWSDGLAILPPTEERVSWILTGTDLPRNTVMGKILPGGGIATVEMFAISLAMAGGRPEYLPVLIAAMKAILNPLMRHQSMNSTTCSCFPIVVVNGPIAKQIRLNSGYGCLGPDPLHPAGASIGRAVRLLIQIVGKAVPGSGCMATFGAPTNYTNVVFAEDEEGLPSGWQPLSVERGFPEGSNVVTVSPALGAVNISGGGTANTREEALKNLYKITTVMRNAIHNYFQDNFREGSPGTVLITKYGVQGLTALGWSKQAVKTFLWENSILPWSVIKKAMSSKDIESYSQMTGLKKNAPWPIGSRPENIMLVVAGGEQSGHCYWMQGAWPALQPVSVEMDLPANWNKLLKEAEEDYASVLSN